MLDKSPEAFRTISEAAEELNVPQHVLRFWETRFAQIKPLKRGGGRRYYRPGDLDLLKGIRRLLYTEGYTIRGVQKIFREDGSAHVASIGRGEAPVRKRDLAELEAEGVPPAGAAKFAPRVGRTAPLPGKAPLARPLDDGAPQILYRLSDSHTDSLKAALKDLGEARKLLDPSGKP
jgi:DNA-binding transcriptional MerR regulator